MRKLLFSLTLVVLAIIGSASATTLFRYSAPVISISSTTSTPYLVGNVPPNSPTLSVCNSPANAVPCTNYATTYTSAGVACSNGAQDTPDPQPSNCQTSGDGQGNIGFWAPAGTYTWTACIPNSTTCYGPYTVTIGATGSSGVTGSGTSGVLPVWTGSTSLGNSYFSESGGPGQNGVVQLNAGTLEFDTTLCPSGGCGVMTFPSPSNFGGIFMNTNSTEIFPNVNFLNAFKVNGDGSGHNYITVPQQQLANAPTAGIGSLWYCTDCASNTNPCSTSGGTGHGTFAFQINGTNVCPF